MRVVRTRTVLPGQENRKFCRLNNSWKQSAKLFIWLQVRCIIIGIFCKTNHWVGIRLYRDVFGMCCTYVFPILICNFSGGFYHYFILGVIGERLYRP